MREQAFVVPHAGLWQAKCESWTYACHPFPVNHFFSPLSSTLLCGNSFTNVLIPSPDPSLP